eukprot:1186120-Prorocentrum_minimum.AAC.2
MQRPTKGKNQAFLQLECTVPNHDSSMIVLLSSVSEGRASGKGLWRVECALAVISAGGPVKRSNIHVYLNDLRVNEAIFCGGKGIRRLRCRPLSPHLRLRRRPQPHLKPRKFTPETDKFIPETGKFTPEMGKFAPETGKFTPETGKFTPEMGIFPPPPERGEFTPERGEFTPWTGGFTPKVWADSPLRCGRIHPLDGRIHP